MEIRTAAVFMKRTPAHQGGADSPQRFYFAARNHLLMASRTDPGRSRLGAACRSASIVMLNLAHAVVSRSGPMAGRFGGVVRGTRDYAAGRFGPGPP